MRELFILLLVFMFGSNVLGNRAYVVSGINNELQLKYNTDLNIGGNIGLRINYKKYSLFEFETSIFYSRLAPSYDLNLSKKRLLNSKLSFAGISLTPILKKKFCKKYDFFFEGGLNIALNLFSKIQGEAIVYRPNSAELLYQQVNSSADLKLINFGLYLGTKYNTSFSGKELGLSPYMVLGLLNFANYDETIYQNQIGIKLFF